MKTEDFRQPETADHPPTMGAAESMGGVEHQLQAASARDFLQRLDLAGTAPYMCS
jgi:hypothetical protein